MGGPGVYLSLMFVRYTVMCIEVIKYTQTLRALSLIIPPMFARDINA